MIHVSNGRIPDDLQSLDGIGEVTAEKLITAGIPTPVSLASSTVPKLVRIGIAKTTAMKILKSAQERCYSLHGFVSGADLIDQYNQREYLTTGSQALDTILGGKGFETQKVYEVYGPQSADITNFAHQLICTAFLPPDQGGLGSGTIYIDTAGGFSIRRIRDLAPRFGIDPAEITHNIIKATPPTSDVLLFLIQNQLEKLFLQTKYRFFCLDSIACHFRSEYGSERVLIPERNQKAIKILHTIRRFIRQVNGVALILNQVEESVVPWGLPWVPWGRPWIQDFHASLRLRTRSTSNGLREFKIENALDLPPERCEIYFGGEGFTDKRQRKADSQMDATL